jgi:hypothetical protein
MTDADKSTPPDVEVTIALDGAADLLRWVVAAESLDERLDRARVAKAAFNNALDSLDQDDFNARLRAEVKRAVQGNPN